MEFFDCSTYFGKPSNGSLLPPDDAESLLKAMDRAGIARAAVWHIAQFDADPLTGNALLTEAIKFHPRLVGSWTILPTQTGETEEPNKWLDRAYDARVRLLRAFPIEGRYLLRAGGVGDLLTTIARRRFPLVLSFRNPPAGGERVLWDNASDLLEEFPALTLILSDLHVWPTDRFFRPLIEKYPRVHIETSRYLADGGIEAFAKRYGAGRMLFGSGYPNCYHGSAMLALAHAEIRDDEKAAIAAGNLDRLLSEIQR
jgi:hypothetical protein